MAKDPIPVAILTAVSSRPQAEKISLEQQMRDAEEHIASHHPDWVIIARLVGRGVTRSEWSQFSEAVEGYGKKTAPGDQNIYAELKDLLDQRKIRYLVIRDWDRLGRDRGLTASIASYARRRKCSIYTYTKPITGHPLTDMMLQSASEMSSEVEQWQRKDRFADGMEGRVRQGLISSSVVPFGYRAEWVKHPTKERFIRTAVVEPVEAAAFRWMVEATVSGIHTQAEILSAMQEQFPYRRWSAVGLRDMFRNPFYKGVIIRRWHRIDRETYEAQGIHQPLLSVAEWDELQALLDARAITRRPETKAFLWAGIIYCGYCDRIMTYSSNGKGHRGYMCRTHREFGKCPGGGGTNFISEPKLTVLIGTYLRAIYEQNHGDISLALLKPDREIVDRTPAIYAEIDRIKKRQQNLVVLFENEKIDMDTFGLRWEEHKQALVKMDAMLQEVLIEMRDSAGAGQRIALLQDIMPNIEARLLAIDTREANTLLRRIFRRIDIRDQVIVDML